MCIKIGKEQPPQPPKGAEELLALRKKKEKETGTTEYDPAA
jgi:hypothetical protein